MRRPKAPALAQEREQNKTADSVSDGDGDDGASGFVHGLVGRLSKAADRSCSSIGVVSIPIFVSRTFVADPAEETKRGAG